MQSVLPRVALAALLATAAAACSSSEPVAMPRGQSVAVSGPAGPCTPPAPFDGPAPQLFPQTLGLPQGATVTDVVELPAGVVLEGYAERDVTDLLTEFQQLLADGGFTVERVDNEVREAEVWFSSGERQGQVLLSHTRCPEGASGFRVVSGFQYDVTPGATPSSPNGA